MTGSEGMTYPLQLQRVLGSGYLVSGFANSGHTMLKKGLCGDDKGCGGDCSYWNKDIFYNAMRSEPDIVTIMLGTNDAKHCNFDASPSDWHDPKCVGCPVQGHGASFEADYRDMIRTLKALPSKPRVFVVVPPPLFPPFPFNMSSHVINDVYPVLLRELAKEADGLIDVWSALGGADPVRRAAARGGHCGSEAEECTRDGCHPNDAGLGIIARTLALTIETTSPGAPGREEPAAGRAAAGGGERGPQQQPAVAGRGAAPSAALWAPVVV